MSDNKKEPNLTDHDYDGIKEYDNPLPGWWLATFYASIVFAVFYYSYYELGSGPTLVREFETAKQERELSIAAAGGIKGPDEAALMSAFKNDGIRKTGAALFGVRCASCHGAQGQGLIGPNLTDKFWIHGGKITEVYKTVSEGVLDKGMPAWGGMLKQDEVIALVAFVKSLKGTNPPNPKAAQGAESSD